MLTYFATGNTTQNTSGTVNGSSILLNGLGGMSVGFSNGSIDLSAQNGIVSFQNANFVTFGSAGATTITASFQPPIVSTFSPYQIQSAGTALLSQNNGSSGSASFFPFRADPYVAAGFVDVPVSVSFVTGGNSSGRQTFGVSYGLYSRGTGGNSTTLSAITSGSYTVGVTYNNSTITINQPTTTQTSGYGTGSTTSAGLNITSNYTGLALVQFPIASTLTPGYYWLGIFGSASTSSNSVGLTQSFLGNAMTLTALFPLGSASSNSGTNALNPALDANWYQGLGVFSSAAQTNLPSTVALSAITQNGSILPIMRFLTT